MSNKIATKRHTKVEYSMSEKPIYSVDIALRTIVTKIIREETSGLTHTTTNN